MFFKKTKLVVCAVCGKAIAQKDGRIVDRNRATKAERHTHIDCQESGGTLRAGRRRSTS